MTDGTCPFCGITNSLIIQTAGTAIAIWDKFPVAKGHVLIIPQRHVSSIYDLSESEQSDLWRLVAAIRMNLIEQFEPDGFNIGLNDGIAAGQTVLHAHVHVIPRYFGDVKDPRGGVRWAISDTAAYWE